MVKGCDLSATVKARRLVIDQYELDLRVRYAWRLDHVSGVAISEQGQPNPPLRPLGRRKIIRLLIGAEYAGNHRESIASFGKRRILHL